MRKLLFILLVFISVKTNAQTYQNLGTSPIERAATTKGYFFRNNLLSKGYVYWYTKGQIDSLLNLSKDSLLSKNKNLLDVPNKATARLNLGVTGLLGGKADTGAYVHKTGNKADTISGTKTLTGTIIFYGTTGRWDEGGLRTNRIRRTTNNFIMRIITPSDTSLNYGFEFAPAYNATPSQTNQNYARFLSGNVMALVSGKDSIMVSDNKTMDFGNFRSRLYVNQTGSSTGKTSGFLDDATIISATDYASYRTALPASKGYAFKFEGDAPGLTNGDIEVGAIGKGIILKSPNGTRYRITVNNSGVLVVTGL